MNLYSRVLNNFEILKLERMHENLPIFLESRNVKDDLVLEALYELTEKEILFRNERAEKINIGISNFPYIRTIDDFDFSFQPTVNKTLLLELMTFKFIENKENILFVGTSGVGKTHLATAIGIEACKKRISTYFISCQALIHKLSKAAYENRLDDALRQFGRYKLLIIDEIGYLPQDKQGANLFFQLITKRYEKTSTIITTNQPFSKWGEVFGDITIANAILDRLLHHSYIIKIAGRSYRIKDKIESVNGGDNQNRVQN